jgi:hypothetical protein
MIRQRWPVDVVAESAVAAKQLLWTTTALPSSSRQLLARSLLCRLRAPALNPPRQLVLAPRLHRGVLLRDVGVGMAGDLAGLDAPCADSCGAVMLARRRGSVARSRGSRSRRRPPLSLAPGGRQNPTSVPSGCRPRENPRLRTAVLHFRGLMCLLTLVVFPSRHTLVTELAELGA